MFSPGSAEVHAIWIYIYFCLFFHFNFIIFLPQFLWKCIDFGTFWAQLLTHHANRGRCDINFTEVRSIFIISFKSLILSTLASNMESWTSIFAVGTPIFQRNLIKLHCATLNLGRKRFRNSYFQSPSENPEKRHGWWRVIASNYKGKSRSN